MSLNWHGFFNGFLINHRRQDILAHLDLRRKIIQVHLDHACRLDDAPCTPQESGVHQLGDELWRRHLGLLLIGSLFDPFECVRRLCALKSWPTSAFVDLYTIGELDSCRMGVTATWFCLQHHCQN